MAIAYITPKSRRASYGFTLLELAMVVVILSLILGGGINILNAKMSQARYDETTMKLDAIEQALQDYVLGRSLLPCPASLTALVSSSSFGNEQDTGGGGAGNDGACTGSSSLDAGNAVGGAVPTKTLNLPDEYAFDGWGRRFLYAVDKRFTATDATASYSITDTTIGALTIQNTSGGTNITTKGLVLILSHGPNGHGGYTKGGGSVTPTMFNGGVTNTDELENCNCTSAAAADATPDAVFVQKAPTEDSTTSLNNFDDIVLYYMRYHFYLPINGGVSAF